MRDRAEPAPLLGAPGGDEPADGGAGSVE
jgi:hypothetical protein